MAGRNDIPDARSCMEPDEPRDLALLERTVRPETADDLEDGETAAEDSGAGSFLDRFVPPRPRRE